MLPSVPSQTVTASGTAGNFSLSLPSIAEGKESAWILADVVSGDVATDAEVKAAIEVIAGQVRNRAWLLPSDGAPVHGAFHLVTLASSIVYPMVLHLGGVVNMLRGLRMLSSVWSLNDPPTSSHQLILPQKTMYHRNSIDLISSPMTPSEALHHPNNVGHVVLNIRES